jgi:hypothetical protein
MPCWDDRREHGQTYGESHVQSLRDRIGKLEAMLCAVLTVESMTYENFDHIFDHIDYVEAGFTRNEIENWWKQHQIEDKRRKEAEHQAKLNKLKMMIGNLTSEEVGLLKHVL